MSKTYGVGNFQCLQKSRVPVYHRGGVWIVSRRELYHIPWKGSNMDGVGSRGLIRKNSLTYLTTIFLNSRTTEFY